MQPLFFDTWQSLARTSIITVLAYVSIVLLLRVSGKRTLSKMNAFDFIVTVALGSSLAAVALNQNIALADGIIVFFLFIFLQFVITWLSVRVKSVKKIITSQPVLLLYKGELIDHVRKRERITLEEIYVAARKKGISDLQEIEAIVLETTGDITIISGIEPIRAANTFKDVKFPYNKDLK
jgi:uncharacterized membrane protein YcaP (DUF421 family)